MAGPSKRVRYGSKDFEETVLRWVDEIGSDFSEEDRMNSEDEFILSEHNICNSNHEKTIFATDGTGRDIFRAVMSEKRFATLLSALRFDNPEDREERKKEDPVAAISCLFNVFIENSQSMYGVVQSTTVDEMLLTKD
ncbi:hypothetical protein NQ318_008997 [Aromia moschata]|uniref:PiggyBac transposable element-derived protein domain-containing protein n=1 Tax=Aromia moschata TaxID=1265417 RepID=A0AAV8XCW5_9CUCU|nr:hypothetical protein NQ318_008997 [Aromia moschata]